MSKNIYLTGFMGSGKTTVGKLLARSLKRKFIDMDHMLEKQFRMSIPRVFATKGEEEFRTRENLLLSSLSAREHLVVATGGGVPEKRDNRELMRRSGKTIYLDADLQLCMARLNLADRNSRPMWQDGEALKDLFSRRKTLYRECDLTVHVDKRSPEETSEAIISELLQEHRFSARLGDAECPVIATSQAPEALAELVRGRRVALVTDRNVARIHLNRFRRVLDDPVEIIIQPGERSKTLNSARRIYETLLTRRFDRDDILVAVGGGVVTDLGAFAAATFKRGMDLALVSTTLLGCVDAAVGGKAAVNLGPAKNVVGCFSTPTLVILDMLSLSTLNRKQVSEGLVEAYKTGLVALPDLAELIQLETKRLRARDLPLLAEVAALSAEAKADVVAEDFREAGKRRILNFGHTFGHAAESFHRFKISHGQAVALGMRVATRLSRARGFISEQTAASIESTLRLISPYRVKCPPLEESWEIMRHDKKIRGGRIVFVLLKAIARAVCVDDVSREELAAVLSRIEEESDG